MEDVSKALKDANRLFKTADHLTYVTYPLVKDNKLIITITENLTEAMIKAMEALLYYDRYYKRIMHFPSDFASKFDIFKRMCAPRYNINREYLVMMQDLKDLIEARKKSVMEFIRNDQYVITSNNYELRTLNYQKVKDILNKSKPFFEKVNFILKNVQNK